ncbi:MAG: SRPBCC family protein [Betaproteobacteria bacterium]
MKRRLIVLSGLLAAAFAANAGAQTHADDVALWNGNWAQYQSLESVPLAVRGYVAASQDLTIVIDAPLRKVYRIYSDVGNALGLHPFLKSIVPVRRFEAYGVPTYDFIAYEDIPLPDGTVFHGVTVAQQRFHARAGFYDADSYDVPGIVTHQHITFSRVRGGTQVTEHLTFEAPPQYIAQTVQGGVYAHALVQNGLKTKIEAGLFKGHDGDCDPD